MLVIQVNSEVGEVSTVFVVNSIIGVVADSVSKLLVTVVLEDWEVGVIETVPDLVVSVSNCVGIVTVGVAVFSNDVNSELLENVDDCVILSIVDSVIKLVVIGLVDLHSLVVSCLGVCVTSCVDVLQVQPVVFVDWLVIIFVCSVVSISVTMCVCSLELVG